MVLLIGLVRKGIALLLQVIWACERFINKTEFGHEDADTDKLQPIMANIPLHVATEFMSTVTDEKRKR